MPVSEVLGAHQLKTAALEDCAKTVKTKIVGNVVVIGLVMLVASIYVITAKHLMNIIFNSPNPMRQTIVFLILCKSRAGG